jgi:hypothetical protein
MNQIQMVEVTGRMNWIPWQELFVLKHAAGGYAASEGRIEVGCSCKDVRKV